MAAILDLIKQVEDPSLRQLLENEINTLSRDVKYGLNYERHLPEYSPLFGIKIKEGSRVAIKNEQPIKETYIVEKTSKQKATCRRFSDKTECVFNLNDLVVVATFGEAIFPYLEIVDSICAASDSDLWHLLIESDNYHALQLLTYICPHKVDCIYIDPPYNTGARDWKYNNNYVDSADGWKHSKWLSMMEKRLRIAKTLLTEDGVMIIAIDDYEYPNLLLLLGDLFRGYDFSTVIVNHHPQGGSSDNITRTHEYAVFVTPKGKTVVKGRKSEQFDEEWSLMRGGTDQRNLRTGRPKSFYGVYVDPDTLTVVGVGSPLKKDDVYPTGNTSEGYKIVYPIGQDGKERVWRYTRNSMIKHIQAGDIVSTPNFALKVIKHRDVKYSPVFSLWADPRYNAGTYGTDLLTSILCEENDFSYPKSLYTVEDAIRFVTYDKKNALVLDFFAGSGTTLNAVNLLNKEDGGSRRCIMVTNNEVSENDALALSSQNYKPGDDEWEAKGICKKVTWPRTRLSIEGVDKNRIPLVGDYLSDKQELVNEPRVIKQVFLDGEQIDKSFNLKKQIVAFLKTKKDSLPVKLVKKTSKYLVSETYSSTILFDINSVDEWIDELQDNESVRDVFICTNKTSQFKEIKKRIEDELLPITTVRSLTIPKQEGFKSNVCYFKLGFLDKNLVTLGRQFKEMLTLLWLKAGGKGQMPVIDGDIIPEMLVLPENDFAVLVEEDSFADFKNAIHEHEGVDIHHVFFVTDSEESFYEMSSLIGSCETYQLYKDYIQNFVLDSRRVLK